MGSFFSKQKKLIILRGLPGSGKTELANDLLKKNKNGQIFSVNDFFINDGKFKYDTSKAKEAHLWNQSRAENAMKEGCSLIIINNPNVRKWEARPYVESGIKYGYIIEFIETNSVWKNDVYELSKRDVHNVPIEVIKKMKNQWEKDFTLENVLKSKAPWEN